MINSPVMDYVYTYGDPSRLYLNGTNRCTNQCRFCVRCNCEGLGGASLWGDTEPDLDAMSRAIAERGGAAAYSEFIWCGFGEPTYRLDLITGIADYLRSGGAAIRLNTNGHGALIHGRDLLPELSPVIDGVNVSLNAPDCERYLALCQPVATHLPPERYWEEMLDFLSRAPDYFESVQASVVGSVLTRAEIDASAELAARLGVGFRIR
jgi:TatD DNase family protein